jgi:hypothetical protein
MNTDPQPCSSNEGLLFGICSVADPDLDSIWSVVRQEQLQKSKNLGIECFEQLNDSLDGFYALKVTYEKFTYLHFCPKNCNFHEGSFLQILITINPGWDPDLPKNQNINPDSMNLDIQKCFMCSTSFNSIR